MAIIVKNGTIRVSGQKYKVGEVIHQLNIEEEKRIVTIGVAEYVHETKLVEELQEKKPEENDLQVHENETQLSHYTSKNLSNKQKYKENKEVDESNDGLEKEENLEDFLNKIQNEI